MKTCCHDVSLPMPADTNKAGTIALIGNPNSGKTTLFNRLTGTRQKTGNWPGVTVDRKTGYFELQDLQFEVVDLPGTYSIDVSESSIDENIARHYVKTHRNNLFVNIIDASTLERSLYLTLQLREQGVPVIVLLNMMDMVEKANISIDSKKLQQELKCPVIDVSLKNAFTIVDLQQQIIKSQQLPIEALELEYPEVMEKLLDSISTEKSLNRRESLAYLAKLDLETDFEHPLFKEIVEQTHKNFTYLRAKSFFTHAQNLATSVMTLPQQKARSLTDKWDEWVLGNWTGIPIFLLIIYLLFLFSINIGGAFVDFFDIGSNAIFVEGFGHLLLSLGLPEWVKLILADGVGNGIEVVATFIPIIGTLYLFLTFLEESGYMSRAAFVMDRFMRKVGISGKAFVPLIIGFGCNVPAIMATRTLDSHRERIMTVLMTPFMSCGARLAVYALFAAIFFPHGGQNMVFLLYLTGIGFAVLTAFILRNTLLKGEAEDFLMELPNYQMPGLQNVLINSWNKLKGFATGAGKVIIVVVMIINIINSLGSDGSFGNENTEKSMLSSVARTMTPVFKPMGIEEDNWPATVGILTGVLAKEVVVGTLDSLYSSIDKTETELANQPEFDFWKQMRQAVATIPANLGDTWENLSDPLGLRAVAETENQQQAAEEQSVNLDTFTAMKKRFDGKIGAFAYLLFILLYFPCVAATGAMYRETGKNWALLGVLWSTGLAYGTATIFYQLATFNSHPMQSLLWSGMMLLAFISAIWVLFKSGKNPNQIPIKVNFS